MAMTSSPSASRCRRTPLVERPARRIWLTGMRITWFPEVIIKSSSSGATKIWSTTWPISFSLANALTPLPPREVWR